MKKEKFNDIYREAFREYWAIPAFTNYDTAETFSYADFARGVAKVHLILEQLGVGRGDKVSLIGRDCAEWCMVWVGVVTYGAVIVPILPDFHEDDINNIINHSDSVVVFAGVAYAKMLHPEQMPLVRATLRIKDLEVLKDYTSDACAKTLDAKRLFDERYPQGFTPEDIVYPTDLSNEDTMVINYTSGTTGFSKGVILSANNMVANIVYATSMNVLSAGDTTLAFLPNAHAFGCAFSFLLPLAVGTHTFILGVPPTPSNLIKALKSVRPRLLLSVPLVFEKIYKNVLLPNLSKGSAKVIKNVPLLNKVVYKKVYDALMQTMGGKLEQVIIGGAAMNPEVAQFYTKIEFPYTIGYGMTECAPLVSYTYYKHYKPGSVGAYIDSMCEVRIADTRLIEGEEVGEIQVRGENVCRGYYKLEKATSDLFTADGWMHTGDLGTMEPDGTLTIKGRLKTMLLASNGQNVYPEEIEQKIDLQDGILESVMVQRDNHRFVAVVVLDVERLEKQGIVGDDAIKTFLEKTRQEINQMIPAYAKIHEFEYRKEPFEKTPKQSIKRYLVK